MIQRTVCLPAVTEPLPEAIRLRCLFDCYGNDLPFWEQNNGDAFLCLADGHLTVWGCGDAKELREFIAFLNPNSIFSDQAVLSALGYPPREVLQVLCRDADIPGDTQGETLKSDEIYALLQQGGFVLPSFPAFAVDLCRRLNHGGAQVFARRKLGAAITFYTGQIALLTGLVSLQKGFGTVALRAALQQNRGRKIAVCCREPLVPFYKKNGFQPKYLAGSWICHDEHTAFL